MPLLNGVWLVNAEGAPHQVPDNEAVIDSFVGRGWRVTDLPRDKDSDDEEFQAALAALQKVPEQPPVKKAALAKTKKEDE